MKKERRQTVGLVICFVAMIAIVGAITLANYNKKPQEIPNQKEEEQAKNEDPKDEEEEEDESQITQGDNVQAEIPQPNVPMEKPLSFSEKDVLLWPVDGNVLMNYSMDQTIYFPTLDQYKYHPAIVIQGEVGQDVMCGADGRIDRIEEDDELGMVVYVDFGSGYEGVYGQLSEIAVEEGSLVQPGVKLGVIGEPTHYYAKEGPNVYFQILKDGAPVNPMDLLQ